MKQSTNEYNAIVKHSSLTYFKEDILFCIFHVRPDVRFVLLEEMNVSALLNEGKN